MLTVSDVQALIVITLGDAFVLNRRVRQHSVRVWPYTPRISPMAPPTSEPHRYPRNPTTPWDSYVRLLARPTMVGPRGPKTPT